VKDGRAFDRYGLEQQAELVRHRFLANRGYAVTSAGEPPPFPFGPTVTGLQQG